MAEWQPIETAPRDGTLILVTGVNGLNTVLAAYYWEGDDYSPNPYKGWSGIVNSFGEQRIAEPTHWMPLPEPPSEKD